jgi:hypothetical protein
MPIHITAMRDIGSDAAAKAAELVQDAVDGSLHWAHRPRLVANRRRETEGAEDVPRAAGLNRTDLPLQLQPAQPQPVSDRAGGSGAAGQREVQRRTGGRGTPGRAGPARAAHAPRSDPTVA